MGLRADRSEVAIKRMDPDKYNERELNNLVNCTSSSSHIVHYFEVVEEEEFMSIIIGLCECNLSDYISQGLTYEKKLNVMWQIIDGIEALHKIHIIHRDLKVKFIV